MGFSRHGTKELFIIGIVCAVLLAISIRYLPYLAPVPAIFFLFSLYFFRDPDRTIPDESNILVSPADGTVADVKRIEDSPMEAPCLRIGIFLSIFDVHVNRCPEQASVRKMTYREGAFHNAQSPEAAEENESHLIEFDGNQFQFAVKQIAGLIARRIVCTLDESETVDRGQRLGMIKFGSRTELYVPLSAEPSAEVKQGETVRGGETVLVRVGDSVS